MELDSFEACLTAKFERRGIRQKWLLEFVGKESVTTFLQDSPDGTYTLTRRLTCDQLCEEAAKAIMIAQETYENGIQEALENLWYNNRMCRKMDAMLGSNYEDGREETAEVIKSNDGSHLLRCPVNACTSSTYKLRRHLRDSHTTYSQEDHELAVEITRKMEQNKNLLVEDGIKTAEPVNKTIKKKTKDGPLNLVTRKSNYKSCLLCKNLYMNLPDHMTKFHKISRSDPKYDSYIRDPPTIPKCYTKCVEGRTVALEGVELETARVKFNNAVEVQETELQSRKRLREEIININEKLKCEDETEERGTMMTKMQELKDEYKDCRYPDGRVYSESSSTWKDSYLKFLRNQQSRNPQRVQRMSMDVFLKYEQNCGTPLTYSELSNPMTVKKILLQFRESEELSYLSKLKYVGQFGSFMEFLMISIESPEAKTEENTQDLAARQMRHEQIKTEIKNEIAILNKIKGKDIINKNERARKKLISDEEMEELMERIKVYLKEVLNDIKNKTHDQYKRKEITKVRDSLISVGTVRLGRRSLEMTEMTLQEVRDATVTVIDGSKYYNIRVAEQKNTYTGKPALVVYDETEYNVLIAYINDLRPKITSDQNCAIVFPAYPKVNSKINGKLGLSAAYKILQKFETKFGKKISSRTIRGSKVTNSRENNLPEEHLNHLANSMNHSRSTANSYYDYSSLENSISHVLKKTKSLPSSTPRKESSPTSFSPRPSTSYHDENTSFSSKRKLPEINHSSSSDEADETLIQLRSKKIKGHAPLPTDSLREAVEKIVTKMKMDNSISFVSKSGIIKVAPITRELPGELKNASTKVLRSIVKEFI